MPRQAMDFASMGSSLGRQIMDAGNAQESAKTNMGLLLAKQSQAQSAANENNAQADYFKTKGDLDRQRAQYQTPEFASTVGAETAGISSSLAKEFDDFKEKGNWGMADAMPNEALQMTMAPQPKAAPAGYSPEVLNRYNAGRAAHVIGLGSTGNSTNEQTVKAIADLLARGDYDAAKASPESLLKYGQAQYAQKGGAPFSQDGTGVLNVLSGNSVAKPEWQAVQKSIAAENAAQATSAYASAGNSNANRQKTLAEIDGIKAGTAVKWQVIQTANGAAQVNPATGEVRPLMMGGNPIMSPKSQAKETQDLQASISTQQVLDQAATLFKHPGRSMGTGASSFMSAFPGTDARGFKANLDTFKAQTFVPMVSALKGMGALSDAEGKKLSDSVGALDPSMPEKEFEKSLQGVTQILYEKAKAAGLNVSLPDFTGAVESIKQPENAGTGSGPTDAAIAHLVKNPNLAPAFAAKYGKDATDRALGKGR